MNTRNLSAEAEAVGVTKDQLIHDFKTVVADAEALLRATAGQGGEALTAARARAEESLAAVKARMIESEAAVIARTKAAARATDEYVHVHPWQAVGAAASLGLVIGVLIGRR